MCIWYQPSQLPTRPLPDPRIEWIAWGVVFDNDSDGRPDARFGIDNLPDGGGRAWLTDLHAGTTEVVVGRTPRDTIDHPRFWEAEFPFGQGSRPGYGYFWLYPGASGPAGHFYVWAAMIRGGEIVSMDFAPDAGWLDGRPD